MDAVWISRIWRDTVWAMLHNIKIRQNRFIKTAAVTPFGSGSSAGINIDLPGTGESGSEPEMYDGPFSVTFLPVEEEKEEGDQELFPSLALKGGMLTVGSSRFVIEDAVYPGGPGVFYAEVIYDDTLEDYWYGVYFEADLPADTDPKRWFCRISTVDFDPEAQKPALAIDQIWKGGDLEVTGRWVE